ncbi:MAG TPA: S8 family peptidase [Vicinamibacterales bacterium]|nr:S8 family peptidase [Vicinamibacterales bacterium]
MLLLAAFAPSAMAEGNHSQAVHKAAPGRPNSIVKSYKLDGELEHRATRNESNHKTRVIVELVPGAKLPGSFNSYKRGGKLGIINGQVIDVPDRLLRELSQHPSVFRVHYDRPAAKFNYRTSLTVGTRAIRQTLGLTGAGVNVAVIDSGIAAWHDDLTNNSTALYPFGNQRVAGFVDFVNGQSQPYDDNGHGTHVAGIIAGNGLDSDGRKSGAAPDAGIVSLKVLDANGSGTVSNIIAALDWVLANHDAYNIRVVNLSVGAAIHESAWTDPLTLAAKRVVDAGVTVVAAAGNFGKNSAGLPQYGGINAPGNAPWVLTVGASSTQGSSQRTDDVVGAYSSRGPTYIDWTAKPDLVAPGTGTVSLAAAGSMYYQTKVSALLPGTIQTPNLPYLSLTGTSMSAPVVAGTVALMLQANPSLTPNAVKAILQYTAQQYPGYNALSQGAGFLNAVGAVRLARFYANAQPGDRVPVQKMWSKHIIWGNHRLGSGVLSLGANAFSVGTSWGVARADNGDNIVWGTACGTPTCDGDNIVWGTAAGDNIVWGTAVDGDNIVWGTDGGDNIVWGTDCGGADCDGVAWGSSDGDNIVWGTADPGDNIVWGTAGDNIVWGTAAGDNIVWGTEAGDNIVWGTVNDGDNIVWGTDDGDNIVWGTDAGDNIVWGTDDGDNIVWGTDAGDNIVWGTATDGDNIVWGTAGSLTTVWMGSPAGVQRSLTGNQVFDRLGDRQLLELLEYAPPPVLAAPAPPPAPVTDPPPSDPPITRGTLGDPTLPASQPPSDPTAAGATTPTNTTPTPSRPGGGF